MYVFLIIDKLWLIEKISGRSDTSGGPCLDLKRQLYASSPDAVISIAICGV